MNLKTYSIGKLTPKGKEIILQEQNNGCILCISHAKDKDGYVRIFANGKHDRLYRVLYEKSNGKIPKGFVLRHTCDNSSCCNIDHLIIGTQYDNVQDMISRNRAKYGAVEMKSFGEKNGQHKLTEQQVIEIFKSNKSQRTLSIEYKVSRMTIYNIKHKIYWKELLNKL